MNHIFVYGTLMKGFHNHERFLARYVTGGVPGVMEGELYHLAYGYPAAVDGRGTVRGEIYTVMDMDNVLPALDWLEEFNQPGEEDQYIREIREVRDINGNIILCYVYLWSAERLQELRENGVYIKDGDWRNFIRDNNLMPEEDS